MTPDTLFKLSMLFALVGWILLIVVSPYWKSAERIVIGINITMLCIVYSWLNFSNFDPSLFQKFSTLDGVMGLFKSEEIVVACWAHILAIDLMVAIWIKRNAAKNGIPYWLTVIILLITYALAPFGLLIYFLVRWIKTKKYFVEDFG